ncbi:unnamed protein product, partial [Phaeothamnion confervicola]
AWKRRLDGGSALLNSSGGVGVDVGGDGSKGGGGGSDSGSGGAGSSDGGGGSCDDGEGGGGGGPVAIELPFGIHESRLLVAADALAAARRRRNLPSPSDALDYRDLTANGRRCQNPRRRCHDDDYIDDAENCSFGGDSGDTGGSRRAENGSRGTGSINYNGAAGNTSRPQPKHGTTEASPDGNNTSQAADADDPPAAFRLAGDSRNDETATAVAAAAELPLSFATVHDMCDALLASLQHVVVTDDGVNYNPGDVDIPSKQRREEAVTAPLNKTDTLFADEAHRQRAPAAVVVAAAAAKYKTLSMAAAPISPSIASTVCETTSPAADRRRCMEERAVSGGTGRRRLPLGPVAIGCGADAMPRRGGG